MSASTPDADFVKRDRGAPTGYFSLEAAGLRWLPCVDGCPHYDAVLTRYQQVRSLKPRYWERMPPRTMTMSTAAMVTYAYDQIDQARARLNTVSE